MQKAMKFNISTADGRPATLQERGWTTLHERRFRRVRFMDGADKENERRGGEL